MSIALTERRLLNGLRIALLIVAVVVQFGLSLPPALRRIGRADGVWLESAAYILLALVGVGGAFFVVRRRYFAPSVRWLGVAAVLLASALVCMALPPEPLVRINHWYFGLIGWYGLFLLFDLPMVVITAFLATHLTMTMGVVVVVGAPVVELASSAIQCVSVLGLQLGLGLAALVVRRVARSATESFRAAESIRTAEVAAALLHRDRERRYAQLLETTAPLLAALATGTLDPAAEGTRRRCAIEAARMRRLFAENDNTSDRLLHSLQAAIDVAERHGVVVQLAVRGEPCQLAAEVRRELLEPITEALITATSVARVTLMRRPGQVRVSVVSDVVEVPAPNPQLHHVRVNRVASGSSLWMEAVWEPRSR
ncbi:hypothetical protein ACQP1S_06435 [Micromonospora matsumotoense]|uniref:hypothetical protein n=1 Tax=Micromonospora matsumotoense TaxID=121616 RepID=UPI003D91297D